jgi:hypothetical protein
MYKKIALFLFLVVLLISCGRPAKPVAKVAGTWISFEQWQVYEKSHGLSKDAAGEKLKTGLEQLVRREIAFERSKRKGLLGSSDWDEQTKKVQKSVLIKNYVLDHYLQGKSEPDAEDVKAVMKENNSLRHIQGVPVKDLGAAKAVVEELRKGADIKQLFEKHKGEVKNAPPSYDFGQGKISQLPPQIQQVFFSAAPGTVLDPIQFGDAGYIVPVLMELTEPDPNLKPDENSIKRAASARFQKAAKKANEELAAKYPEAFDKALIDTLLKNEKPTEEELNKSVGSIGKEKILYSELLESYYNEAQREASPLPRTSEVFQGLFKMLASDRRIALAAEDEGYLKKESVAAQIWDFTHEIASMKFTQDFLKEAVVKDDEGKKYYEAHKTIFRASDRYNLRYLISGDPRFIQNALVMMKKGASFESVLKAPGILPETGNGNIGWKNEEDLKNMFSPRLVSMIKKAEKGSWAADQIGPQKFGAFQIFDIEKGSIVDFEKARDDVRQLYIRENGAKLIQDYLDGEGKSGIKVETFPQNLV